MTEADRPQFMTAVKAMLAGHGRQADAATFEAYWIAVDDLPIETVLGAIKATIRESKFPPNPATVREFAGIGAAQQANSSWLKLIGQVRAVGYIGRPDIDETTAKVVQILGGWRYLCSLDSDRIHGAYRDSFLREFTVRAVRQVLPPATAMALLDRMDA